MAEPLLRVEDLTLTFRDDHRPRRVLDRVTFEVQAHEVMGLVGEAARVQAGRIRFEGRDLLALPERELRQVRGWRIAMIFQNPRAALNPLMRAGDQVARAVRLHRGQDGHTAYETAVELLRHVGIPDAQVRSRAYPHQLSGGMAQRVLIAIMLACRPKLLIADEPTTGLDVTIQAQIFELIQKVQAETGAALLLITHDLGVVSEVCQRVAVLYAGQIMEVAPVADLFARPQHPYTVRLLSSLLRVDRPGDLDTAQALAPIGIRDDIPGCRFANRCPDVRPVCWERRPPPFAVSGPPAAGSASGHSVVCHKYVEVG